MPENFNNQKLGKPQSKLPQSELPQSKAPQAKEFQTREKPKALSKYQVSKAVKSPEKPKIAGSRSARARGGAEKLLTRSLSGILYALAIVVCIFLGTIPTAIIFAAMAWLCCSEFFRIARQMGRTPNEFLGLTCCIFFTLLPVWHNSINLFPFVLSFFLLLVGIWYVWSPRVSIGDAAITVFAPIYTGYLMSSIVAIRQMHHVGTDYSWVFAALLTFGVISSIWGSDALAYLVGSKFGSLKMTPKISPNKTWEGFFGGMLGSVFVWILMWLVGIPGINLFLAIFGGLIVGFVGVVGDLFESRLKRGAGVKDAGSFIPGHGGMLDRSDSVLFGCAAAYFVLVIAGFVF